ncbi:MAG: energy-coupling factor transporter transmembrane component T [Candidatus Izemoplasmatales bacterium]|jgi:energy-coupling factor transport system permease protein|nr:energy-coupling factor transporter transmembrane component T [Candidatus Izemoplasmatales bacterium]
MKNVVIGQYIPGNSFFYHIDPRTKIIAVVILMVATFLLETIWQVLAGFGIALILIVAGRVPIRKIIKGLKPLYILLLFTLVFQVAFNRVGTIVLDSTMMISPYSILLMIVATVIWRLLASYKKFSLLLFISYLIGLYFIMKDLAFSPIWTSWQLTIYDQGLIMSGFVIIRLLIIITLSTVLTLTTKPTELTQGLESLLRPLKVIGLNSEDFALIISISLRYIPTILDEANKIMNAQASRGADFAEGRLKDKVVQVISLLVPMFIIAFKRSEELADAMESRDFVPGKPRTRIHDLKFNYRDLVTAVITVLCLTGSILVKVL